MSRYRKAIYLSLSGGPIMASSMLLGGGALSISIIFGFVTVVIALSGLHLGLWARSN